MAIAMKRADATSPEVEINGERWGNRRETPHEYETVALERAVYPQSGRGRVAVPLDLRLGMVEGTYTQIDQRVARANGPRRSSGRRWGSWGPHITFIRRKATTWAVNAENCQSI